MNKHTLWYRSPAPLYTRAFPLGNGRLGALVRGGVKEERINLNEDTLWSGYPRTNSIYNAYDRYTRRLRRALLSEGDFYAAEDFADKLQGPYNESYLSAGELFFTVHHGEEAKNYVRALDLTRGVATVRYEADGATYVREHFCSAPDDVIYIRIRSEKKGALSLSGGLTSYIRHGVTAKDGVLLLEGRAPRHVEPHYLERDLGDAAAIVYDERWEETKGLRFVIGLGVTAEGGRLTVDKDGFALTDGDSCTLCLWLGTSLNPRRFLDDPTGFAYSDERLDLASRAAAVIGAAQREGFDACLCRHEADMKGYFDRVSLSLSYDASLDALPTDERKARYDGGGADGGLEALAFDFGRYLLYSCSREGTQAANLQGIWCWKMRPEWSCNYTTNINTQMNYFAVEVLGMPECHMPLLTMLDELTHTGAVAAGELYGARGFCVHHNVDLWRAAAPIGMGRSDAKWALFPTAGIWLTLHVGEHYRFTKDRDFLRRYFHVMKGAALFAIDMMCKLPNGKLGICPTTVPERRFALPNGDSFSVGYGSTFDYQLVRQLFADVREAVSVLSLSEEELLSEINAVSARLPDALPLAEDGSIADYPFACTPEPYLWLNRLFGVFPGNTLLDRTPEEDEAVRKTFYGYDLCTGTFSNTWSAAVAARLEDAEGSYARMRHHLSYVMLPSLIGLNRNVPAGEVFQIDSNLGYIAALAEMLVQSTPDTVTLLPALPKAWESGCVRDFCTRCGCKVSFAWEKGTLTSLSLTAKESGTVRVRLCDTGKAQAVTLAAGETVTIL